MKQEEANRCSDGLNRVLEILSEVPVARSDRLFAKIDQGIQIIRGVGLLVLSSVPKEESPAKPAEGKKN